MLISLAPGCPVSTRMTPRGSTSTPATDRPASCTPFINRRASTFLNLLGPRANLDRSFVGAVDVGFFNAPSRSERGENLAVLNRAFPPTSGTFRGVLSISWAYPPFCHNRLRQGPAASRRLGRSRNWSRKLPRVQCGLRSGDRYCSLSRCHVRRGALALRGIWVPIGIYSAKTATVDNVRLALVNGVMFTDPGHGVAFVRHMTPLGVPLLVCLTRWHVRAKGSC